MNDDNGQTRDWRERIEQDIRSNRASIQALTEQVTRAVTSVETLSSQVSALFGRVNRPIDWGSIIAAVTLLALAVGLVIAPMKSEDHQLREDLQVLQEIVRAHQLVDLQEMGKFGSDIEWLKRMEARIDDRIHQSIDANGHGD